MLLQHGANIYERDDEGQTPLVRVTAKGFPLMQFTIGVWSEGHGITMD